jgi:hypothetical protein
MIFLWVFLGVAYTLFLGPWIVNLFVDPLLKFGNYLTRIDDDRKRYWRAHGGDRFLRKIVWNLGLILLVIFLILIIMVIGVLGGPIVWIRYSKNIIRGKNR